MKTLLSLAIALIAVAFAIEDADARGLSGGRNMGMQRAPAQRQSAPKAPAQQQQQQQAAPATPAQQPAGASKWLGPLAGFALGAGLAALFLNNGLAGLLTGLLLIGLIVAAAALAARALSRGRVAREPIQYAGAGAGGGGHPTLGALPGGAGAIFGCGDPWNAGPSASMPANSCGTRGATSCGFRKPTTGRISR